MKVADAHILDVQDMEIARPVLLTIEKMENFQLVFSLQKEKKLTIDPGKIYRDIIDSSNKFQKLALL